MKEIKPKPCKIRRIYLIRHGKTKGNLEGRYVGSTDEPLCPVGRDELLAARRAFDLWPARVYASPMRRCLETAEIFFPDIRPVTVPDFRECSFGAAEYRNYRELSGEPFYQAWIDGGGVGSFPGAEETNAFKARCRRAFLAVLEQEWTRGGDAACVVHGGTIMSIMEAFALPRRSYFDWQVKNGSVLTLALEPEIWAGEGRLRVIEP